MKVWFDADAELSAFAQLLRQAEQTAGCQGVLVLAAIGNHWPLDAANQLLESLTLPCAGGLFPALLYRGEVHHQGVLVVALLRPLQVRLVQALEQVDDLSALELTTTETGGDETLFCVVDGYARRSSALIEQIYFSFGLQANYLGGGAGALGQPGVPCVISNAGIHADALVIARIPGHVGLGIAHGYSPISDTLQVTAAVGNRLQSINYEPAAEVYCRLVERAELLRGNDAVDWGDFLSVASRYPLGMPRLGNKLVVRDPIATHEDGSLTLVGEVFERGQLQLLSASEGDLVAAAEQATQLAMGASVGLARGKLLFCCVSRYLLRRDPGFGAELTPLFADTSLPTAGVLSIGEIANDGRDFLEFYNKTVVVAVL